MTFPTDRHLMEICGLNSDGINGYRACMAKQGKRTLPPEHLRGPRLDAYERGEQVAMLFYAHRIAAGNIRRRSRNEELKAIGIKTVLMDAASHRQEREDVLRRIASSMAS